MRKKPPVIEVMCGYYAPNEKSLFQHLGVCPTCIRFGEDRALGCIMKKLHEIQDQLNEGYGRCE